MPFGGAATSSAVEVAPDRTSRESSPAVRAPTTCGCASVAARTTATSASLPGEGPGAPGRLMSRFLATQEMPSLAGPCHPGASYARRGQSKVAAQGRPASHIHRDRAPDDGRSRLVLVTHGSLGCPWRVKRGPPRQQGDAARSGDTESVLMVVCAVAIEPIAGKPKRLSPLVPTGGNGIPDSRAGRRFWRMVGDERGRLTVQLPLAHHRRSPRL